MTANIQPIELLETLLLEFKDKLALMDGIVPREATFPQAANQIKVAIGVRRCGKTYLCLEKVRQYLQAGIPLSRILYINFEDDRLIPAGQEKLVSLLEAFYTLYPENHDQLCYLFLDEIQNVEGWPIVIRRFLDTRRVEIFLTGSSSKLLSKEIATSLRGRSLSTEVWPYSFKEYLSARQIMSVTSLAKKPMDQMREVFLKYLVEGGFPDAVNLPPDEQRQFLQELVDVVVFRDIIERHGITNISLVKYLIKTLINNTATRFTVNKFCKDLKSQGIHVSKNTIHDYLVYIEDAFLVFHVPIYSPSLRKEQTSAKKIYVVDTGLYHAYAIGFRPSLSGAFKNFGRVFENFVYLTFRREKREIFYYVTKSGYEIDFLTRSQDGTTKLYQVAWETDDPETLAREERALEEAKAELGIDGSIITLKNYLSKL